MSNRQDEESQARKADTLRSDRRLLAADRDVDPPAAAEEAEAAEEAGAGVEAGDVQPAQHGPHPEASPEWRDFYALIRARIRDMREI
ncbi:hypothetical protein ACFO9Q_21495 [Paenibacillus sp. GCM10023252]|uniref:hypothetical protein n=1 Tax=Paenibacillus sp. GCM10023252 TaxID=3252649 RepID=UPI00361BD6A9